MITPRKIKQAAQNERFSSELHVSMMLVFVHMLFLLIKNILEHDIQILCL